MSNKIGRRKLFYGWYYETFRTEREQNALRLFLDKGIISEDLHEKDRRKARWYLFTHSSTVSSSV